MSISSFNRRWATVILEALSRHGVRHICIAPGSRSTPLTLAAAEKRGFICHTHFDERGLGHLALGLAKGSGEPVALIVTSGTAVANLYPAIIEAEATGERLVALTADRPPELIDCGVNQAIRQTDIFSAHVARALALPRPTRDIPARWLVSRIDGAMGELRAGALHINCPFAEPLYGEMDDSGLNWQEALGNWWQDDKTWLYYRDERTVTKQPDWFFWRQKRGVVVAGRMTAQEGASVASWAKTLGWPLIGDVLSQTGQPLPCADLWLNHPAALETLQQAQIVIQFGVGLTGKRLLQWQASARPENWWLIGAQAGLRDPGWHRGRRIVSSVDDWLTLHPAENRGPWAPSLNALALRARNTARARCNSWGEAQLACRLPELLPGQGQLFIGNSLAIRLVDAFAQLPVGYPVYSNRGASGIDGLISTAAGVQRATARRTLAVIGDLSALYDINSLALLRHISAPLVLIVINNNGGQIFSLLPTPESRRKRFYLMPQNVEFAGAAAMFGLHYVKPDDWESLRLAVEQAWQRPNATLIELIAEPDSGVHTLQKLVAEMSQP